MFVKFCGMTNYEDAKAAVDLNVDYIGFVFYKKSPRYINPRLVKEILHKIGKNIKSVGVFVEETQEQILDIMNYCGLDFAQAYNNFNIQNMIRAYRVNSYLPQQIFNGLVLIDSFTKQIGGSAKVFNWELLDGFEAKDRAFIAGGVSINNLEELSKHKVFGVDLVSSIEDYPGKKDYQKMKLFMELARSLK